MKEEKTEKIHWSTIVAIFIAILILGLTLSRVRVEFEMDCNSGNIGIDYSGRWLNQTEFLNEFIKIKDIDGLNCKVKGKIDMPWWLALLP